MNIQMNGTFIQYKSEEFDAVHYGLECVCGHKLYCHGAYSYPLDSYLYAYEVHTSQCVLCGVAYDKNKEGYFVCEKFRIT